MNKPSFGGIAVKRSDYGEFPRMWELWHNGELLSSFIGFGEAMGEAGIRALSHLGTLIAVIDDELPR